jgi:flagellar hook-associated protein 3 FlgL
MVTTNSGFYQNNIDLFKSLDRKISDIQVQVSTGKKSLSMKENVQDISRLSAAKEHETEITKFKTNAERVITDLTLIDVSFDQLQNASIRLTELYVQSSSSFIQPHQRELFQSEISSIKNEILNLANGRDALGNSYFSGTSGQVEPFNSNNMGAISYSGSAVGKSLQVGRDHHLRQNFSGEEVFSSVGPTGSKFSIFEAIDEFSRSLDYDMGSVQSSNIFSTGSPKEISLPQSGAAANYKFDLIVNGTAHKIGANAYSNDFSGVVAAINDLTGVSGVSASILPGNKIKLMGAVADVKISNYVTDLPLEADQEMRIGAVGGPINNAEILLPKNIVNQEIKGKLDHVFEHVVAMRSDLSIAASAAQNTVQMADETLINLSVDVSSIEDADLAALLTELQNLLTSKEAAQATFSRISSKSLFDFLG